MKIQEIFGRNVKRLRHNQQLSQEDLAIKAGVHRTYVGMIERGEKNITITNMEKFAHALNVPISKLLN